MRVLQCQLSSLALLMGGKALFYSDIKTLICSG
jgi:hypothetical protein